MKLRTRILTVAGVCALCTAAHALYSVSPTGDWPKNWPRQLEPLRKQAQTLVGPMVAQRHYAIRFTSREQFEEAWPHLLKMKTKGAPIFLVKGPSFFLSGEAKGGVIFHSPPEGQSKNPETPEAPLAGVKELRVRWMNTNYIDLVVDGEIIDPARIKMPKDAPVIDEREKAK